MVMLVTPVGSSDSHDVARYIVGQGRTYIRCDDRDVAHLDLEAAVVISCKAAYWLARAA